MSTLGRVVVVGAGISGLAAAFRLKQAGAQVTVLEAADHVGGRMSTIEHDGYRIDVGASLLTTAYSEMMALIEDAGLSDEMVPTSDLIGILRDGVIHRLRSHSKLDGVRTSLLTTRGKLAMRGLLVDLVRNGSRLNANDLSGAASLDNETLRDYVLRRMGPEALDHLVEPIANVFYTASAEEMTKVGFLWAIRKFFSGSYFSSPGGVDFLPKGLARHVEVELGARVRQIEETGTGVSVVWQPADGSGERVEEVDGVVIAVSGRQVLDVFPQLDDERRAMLRAMDFTSSIHVHLGLSRPPAEQAMMLFVGPEERRSLNVVILEHNKAPGRVPEGKGMLSTTWYSRWGLAHTDLDDAKVVAAAVQEIEHVLPYLVTEIETAVVTRWDPCVLLARPGICAAISSFKRASATDTRVQLAGDYFSFSTTNSSVCSGEHAARRLVEALGTPRT